MNLFLFDAALLDDGGNVIRDKLTISLRSRVVSVK